MSRRQKAPLYSHGHDSRAQKKLCLLYAPKLGSCLPAERILAETTTILENAVESLKECVFPFIQMWQIGESKVHCSPVRTSSTTSDFLLEYPTLHCRQVDYCKNHQDWNKLLQACYAHWLSQRDRVNSYNHHGTVLCWCRCIRIACSFFVFLFKLILLLLVSSDTWQTTKCVRVQRLREGLQNGGHCDPLVR